MIGLLDFEGVGIRKRKRRETKERRGRNLLFFLFFFFFGLSMDAFGNLDTLPCVCFFYLLFFFIQLLINNWIRIFFFSERIENEIVCNIAYLLLCLSNGKICS